MECNTNYNHLLDQRAQYPIVPVVIFTVRRVRYFALYESFLWTRCGAEMHAFLYMYCAQHNF